MKTVLAVLVVMAGCSKPQEKPKPCEAPPLRPTFIAKLNADFSYNFNVSCPMGWHAETDPKAEAEYSAKADRGPVDAINFLANHVSCVAGERGKKP